MSKILGEFITNYSTLRFIEFYSKNIEKQQFYFVNYSIHSILICISFQYTAQWSDSHTLHKVRFRSNKKEGNKKR